MAADNLAEALFAASGIAAFAIATSTLLAYSGPVS